MKVVIHNHLPRRAKDHRVQDTENTKDPFPWDVSAWTNGGGGRLGDFIGSASINAKSREEAISKAKTKISGIGNKKVVFKTIGPRGSVESIVDRALNTMSRRGQSHDAVLTGEQQREYELLHARVEKDPNGGWGDLDAREFRQYKFLREKQGLAV